ncbi:membrane protein [Pseudoalteromonas piratica]|uniref:Membrane protein n=1 Tax=Pseudoalteromonas piratica TaxID=1348114 RepID=A0A0A7EHT4_9GAMM|nr:membrane protein [Pseudoalteromonas piratica]
MLNLPFEKRFISAPIILIISAIVIFATPLSELFEYNRTLFATGEYWRIITGHFSHSNGYHLMLNLAGVALIWALHGEYYDSKKYALALFLLALYTGGGLYIFYPENTIYNGLSGVLHGLIIIGALIDCQKGMKTGYLLFIGVWLKIAWEQYTGPSAELGELIEARVAIEAHLIGAVSGIFVYAKLNRNALREQLTQ